MTTALFVCTGNTCRSPMAVGLVKKKLGKRRTVKVISAGVMSSIGRPASINAVKVMGELGIDISSHRSVMLTEDMVEEADLVFVMTQTHKLEVINMLKKPGKEIYLVSDFSSDGSQLGEDISDPIGKPVYVYRSCRDELEKCVPGIIKKIMEK